jgi:hypothetical protein
MFVGILLILVGGFFLLRTLDIIPFWYGWQELWPIAIIAVGLAMVTDATFRRSRRRKEN